MDWNYTGTYKAKGDGYVLEITGGQSSVSDLLAKEKNDAYKCWQKRKTMPTRLPLNLTMTKRLQCI